MAAYGGHTMTGKLHRVMMRMPADPAGDSDWKRFNYQHPIDQNRTAAEHADLVSLLAGEGIDVVLAGKDEAGELDALFTYDPSIITDEGAVLLNMGKAERANEPTIHAATFAEIGIPVLGEVVGPGTVEGGDTLWLDARTMAIGRGYRSNDEGIRQLRVILGTIGVELLVYDLPHWTGPADCPHLLSLISPLAEGKAIVYKPLMAVALLAELEQREWKLIDVPPSEYESMGCNVLAIEPDRVLLLAGNPETQRVLENAGCEVLTYQGEEISLNRAGGRTCLTRPLMRETQPLP